MLSIVKRKKLQSNFNDPITFNPPMADYYVVPEGRVELPSRFRHWLLKPARLPIPPPRRYNFDTSALYNYKSIYMVRESSSIGSLDPILKFSIRIMKKRTFFAHISDEAYFLLIFSGVVNTYLKYL